MQEQLKNLPPEMGFTFQPPPEKEDKVNPVDFPFSMGFIWEYFQELSASRTISQYGFNPIQWQEIESWSRLRGIILKDWHLKSIREIDKTFLEAQSKKLEKSKR